MSGSLTHGRAEGREVPDRYVSFRIGSDHFGVALERVQEVMLDQPMTKVPLADAVIRGLINLRGQVVTVLNMRSVLDYDDFAPDAEPVHIVVTHKEGPISLCVDEEGDYLEIPPSRFHPPPRTMSEAFASRLQGVCELPDRSILMILDVDRALDGAINDSL